MKTVHLADLIDPAELEDLFARFGPGERRSGLVEMPEESFRFWWRKVVKKCTRRGEVVLVMQRPDGKVLLHTKEFYPQGVYRFPTGGVFPDEPVIKAVKREAREETGLDVVIERFLGTVEYEFRWDRETMAFVSYVFLVNVDDSPPIPEDESELICDFRYVALPEIKQIAQQLRSLGPDWSDWGEFRAFPHDMVIDALVRDESDQSG